jgi:hypothetical protein
MVCAQAKKLRLISLGNHFADLQVASCHQRRELAYSRR